MLLSGRWRVSGFEGILRMLSRFECVDCKGICNHYRCKYIYKQDVVVGGSGIVGGGSNGWDFR